MPDFVEFHHLRYFLMTSGLLVIASAVSSGHAAIPPPTLGRDIPAYSASLSNPGPQEIPAPTGTISLSKAFALSLLHNPELAGYSWDLRIQEADRLQAGFRQNPEFFLDVEDFAGTGQYRGLESSQTTLQIGQVFEIGGKRSARLRAASSSVEKAGWEYEARRLELLSEVSKAFVEVVGAQRGVEIAEDAVHLADKTSETLAARAKAGRASVAEEAKVKVAAAMSRIDLEWAKHRLEEAREGLAALWGGSGEPSFTLASDHLDSLADLPHFDTLLGQLRTHPRLAELNSALEVEQARSDLDRANRIPNLTLKGGYRRLAATDDHAVVAGVSLPLPLLNRNQGRVLQGRQRNAQIQRERQTVEIELRGKLAEAYKVALTASREIGLLRTAVIPEVHAAFESVTQGYNQGRYSYLEVLDAQQALVSARLQYIRALVDHHRAAAELESLTGRSLSNSGTERNF